MTPGRSASSGVKTLRLATVDPLLRVSRLVLLGAALFAAGCHDCSEGKVVDVKGSTLAAAGGVTDADRIPGGPSDLEIVLTEGACQRICPAATGGMSLDGQCVEIHMDPGGVWCGPSTSEWYESDPPPPLPPGCVQTVECSYGFQPCSSSPG
jgi:hypothetical protein